ncbi:hypothetical protein [Proteiniphilum sp. X52]|uniref:hypothetical protein n=1 Tax=Proteiniphilum sp. X52 TaxID=2382159 RepID=UPI0011CD5128|nr:hypothetical protein [Proteiniphilum sp. X52]
MLEFRNGEAYSAGLNYNSKTGQLWFLDNYGVGGSLVSQLTWIPGKGFIEHAVGMEGFLNELTDFAGSDTWKDFGHGLNGAAFVARGLAHSTGRALDRTLAYTYSNSATKASQVMFKLPGGNMYIPTGVVKGSSSALKIGGNTLGLIGVGMTFLEIKEGHKELVGEGGVDLIMGFVGFVPGWGWAAAGIYFGGKFLLEATGNDFWNEQ